MSTVVIVQSRMGSTRLPGKVMMPLAGKPILSRLLERLDRMKVPHRTVVATTTSAADDILANFCAEHGVDCFRGSEEDVLSRYFAAAQQFGADLIVRVTADCPLLDPAVIDQAVEAMAVAHGSIDYVSNMLKPTYPYGMAVEVFSMRSLTLAHQNANQIAEREHVTPYIYWNPDQFRLQNIALSSDLSHHRWTVDTSQDYELVKLIFEKLYPSRPHFGLNDILKLMDEHPDWSMINQAIQQIKPKSA